MKDETQAPPPSGNTRKLTAFARRHPMLTMFGIGGAALFGGAELAAGVVLGAGLDALLRRQGPQSEMQETQPVREKSRSLVSRVPHVVRERARAVVDAARGKQPAGAQEIASQPASEIQAQPQQQQRPEQPATD